MERMREIAAMPDGEEKTAARRTVQQLGSGNLRMYAGRSRDDVRR
jgi:hypothetical protein